MSATRKLLPTTSFYFVTIAGLPLDARRALEGRGITFFSDSLYCAYDIDTGAATTNLHVEASEEVLSDWFTEDLFEGQGTPVGGLLFYDEI